MSDPAHVLAVFNGSNSDHTKALYIELMALGAPGVVALNLFRACKASERAKDYRGRKFKVAAYEKKQWSMGLLCEALQAQPVDGISFGWGIDERMRAADAPHFHVLYVDTWCGQISFHTDVRGTGPAYTGQWDGVKDVSAKRACELVAQVLQGARLVRPLVEQVVKETISEAIGRAMPLQLDFFQEKPSA